MRNISGKKKLQRKSGQIFCLKFLSENRAVYEILWKTRYSQTDDRWQCDTAHALCTLDS